MEKFIEEAEHGVVVFSLGSIAKSNTMTAEIKAAFQDAFAEIPQRVIWKFDDSIENLSRNVLLTKWMPQRDILGEISCDLLHCCQFRSENRLNIRIRFASQLNSLCKGSRPHFEN